MVLAPVHTLGTVEDLVLNLEIMRNLEINDLVCRRSTKTLT